MGIFVQSGHPVCGFQLLLYPVTGIYSAETLLGKNYTTYSTSSCTISMGPTISICPTNSRFIFWREIRTDVVGFLILLVDFCGKLGTQ
jgi:hypothetical protein